MVKVDAPLYLRPEDVERGVKGGTIKEVEKISKESKKGNKYSQYRFHFNTPSSMEFILDLFNSEARELVRAWGTTDTEKWNGKDVIFKVIEQTDKNGETIKGSDGKPYRKVLPVPA